MKRNYIKEIFYGLVEDATRGFTLSVNKESFNYARFNYFEEEKRRIEDYSDEEYLGSEDLVDEEYEAEYSNGTVNYIPALRVDNTNEFFDHLDTIIDEYIKFYNLDRLFDKFGEKSVIKDIILTILANARYVDYENPIQYLEKYLDFFRDTTLRKYNKSVIGEQIKSLDNGHIKVTNKKEDYKYETPYALHITIGNDIQVYNLPIINYGISGDTCYIYSIHNERENTNDSFNKKIKKNLYKVNDGVEIDKDYDKKDTILGTTPSFIVATTIFMQILRQNNIGKVRVVTFLPDRYFERLGTTEYDADEIQKNLTEKMVFLFYRLQHHMPKIGINFPSQEGFIQYKDDYIGDDLIIELPEKIECDNNKFLKEILDSIENYNKKQIDFGENR